MLDDVEVVASSGIEPESGASETLILSIVRRGRSGILILDTSILVASIKYPVSI